MSEAAIVDLLNGWADRIEALYDPSDYDDPPAEHLARLLVAIRDCRADLATFADRVEADLLAVMPAKKLVVDGIGELEAKTSVKRTAWQHEQLIPAIVARVADEPGIFYDPETGSLLPFQTIGHNVARRLRECVGFGAGKVTGLKAVGIDPSEYCREEWGDAKIKLPTREV